MDGKTLISSLIEDEDNHEKQIEIVNAVEESMDLSLSNLHRAMALVSLSIEQQYEVCKRLTAMLYLSESRVIHDYLRYLCQHSTLKSDLKFYLCIVLVNEDKEFYETLDDLLFQVTVNNYNESDVKAERIFEMIKVLSTQDIYREHVLDHCVRLISDNDIPIDYRYRCLLSIEKSETIPIDDYIYMQTSFFCNDRNPIVWKIMSSQVLILVDRLKDLVQNKLIEFMSDEELDDMVRADAADVLLDLGDRDCIQLAREVMIQLGKTSGPKTVYSDKQNVHNEYISESAKKVLKKVSEVSPKFAFSYIKNFILSMYQTEIDELKYKCKEEKGEDEIESEVYKSLQEALTEKVNQMEDVSYSFTRIEMDRVQHCGSTLSAILCCLFTIIDEHESREELIERLKEELLDMSNTCSSGHAFRLGSILNGFVQGLEVHISYQDQISANLHGRLCAKMRDIPNEHEQEMVLIEMTCDKLPSEQRKHFTKFFIDNISEIREELWREYCDNEIDGRLIEDTDFDLYFQRAVIYYTDGWKHI